MKSALYAGNVSGSIVIRLTPLPPCFSISLPVFSIPSLHQLSKFLPAQIPTVPNIPLDKNRKRRSLDFENPEEDERRDGGEASKPDHLAGLLALRCGQSQSPAQVCHYFLFHREDLGGYLPLSQIPSCHPRQLVLALGPWRHSIIIIISIKATILMTAAT